MSVNRGLGIPGDEDDGQEVAGHAPCGYQDNLAPTVRKNLFYGDFGAFFVFHPLLPRVVGNNDKYTDTICDSNKNL